MALRDPAMVSKSWKMQTVSLPAENTCIPVVITAVYSPVKFWVQLLPPATLNTGMLVILICTDTIACDCGYLDEEKNRNKYEVTLTQLCEEMKLVSL